MDNKTYWLYLESYVHPTIVEGNILLYNSLSGRHIEVKNKPVITGVMEQLLHNNYSIEITDTDLLHDDLKDFVLLIKKEFFGDIVDQALTLKKPFQIKPFVLINQSTDLDGGNDEYLLYYDLMKNIRELSLYITSHCGQDCRECDGVYKQVPFCTCVSKERGYMSFSAMAVLIEKLRKIGIPRLNILGGNIFEHPEINRVIFLLNLCEMEINYYSHMKNLAQVYTNHKLFKAINTRNSRLTLLINELSTVDAYDHLIEALPFPAENIVYHFVLENEADLARVERFVERHAIQRYLLHSFYNGSNHDFFEKFVFIDSTDIRENTLDMKELLTRKSINTNDFGKVYIMANGDLHTNVNQPALGNIEHEAIQQLIRKEMCDGKSWRRVREAVETCKECLYHHLCPPLSNYEYALGRNNLCHINL